MMYWHVHKRWHMEMWTGTMSGVAAVFCNASALVGIGPPVLSSEGAVLHASAHLHHSMAIQ